MKQLSKKLVVVLAAMFVLALVNFSQASSAAEKSFAKFRELAVSQPNEAKPVAMSLTLPGVSGQGVALEKLHPGAALKEIKDAIVRKLSKGGQLIIGRELSDNEAKDLRNKGLEHIGKLTEGDIRAEFIGGKLDRKDSTDDKFYGWLAQNKILENFIDDNVQRVVIVNNLYSDKEVETPGQAVPKGAVANVKENTIFLSKTFLKMIGEYSNYGELKTLASELKNDLVAESFGEHERDHITKPKAEESEIKDANPIIGFFLMRTWANSIVNATRGLQDLTITNFDRILATLSGKQKPINVVLRGEEFLDANGEIDPQAVILSLNSFKFLNNRSIEFNVKFSIGEDTVNKIKAQDKEKDIVKDLGNAFKYLAPELGNKLVNVEVKIVKSGAVQSEIKEMIDSFKKPDTVLAVATKSVLTKKEAYQITEQGGIAISYLEQQPTGEQFVPYSELIMQAVKGALHVQRGETGDMIAIAVKPLILPKDVRDSLVKALAEFNRLQKLAIKA